MKKFINNVEIVCLTFILFYFEFIKLLFVTSA